ncbi:spore germination lipoprotein GerD [Paenibacillus mucilaginosus]|uniref:Spore germination protein n=2 Tax=Paenibacillus mucilaginosus TaxID=61624 RepID=H6NRY9_9BACL|nr:spore germination lipoprotein GerD [Paenibacillus mucilaginosus]AEI45986.1 spore germination protein [Paenibacillus mucilaginosus KNP414]AFC33618.1 spore germination protein [Paenibacillus mucilaginosus 3016]MCG7217655.1 spore gernimation protein [Paenibacillus mucilaginosus]WDM27330.1 spore gernimation protein [Paenibacillus mucilaginosus]
MIEHWKRIMPAVMIVGFLAACGSEPQQQQAQGSNGNTYKDTKSMVLDILKTEDGRKAIQEATVQNNSKLAVLSAGDTQQLQLAVKDVLVDTDTNKFLQTMITDPKFAGQFAKAIQKETKQLQKDLLKDPEYQKQMMDAMKSPEFEGMLLDTMKSTAYRTQTKQVIQESLQSPLFRLEMMELMKKVLQDESQPKAQSQGGGAAGGGGEEKKEGQGGDQKKEEGGEGGGGEGGGGEGGGSGGGEEGGGGEGGGEEKQGEEGGEKKKQE